MKLQLLFFLGSWPAMMIAQTDSVVLPPVTIREVRFDRTGYPVWRADSLPGSGTLTLADRLLWESPLQVRANGPGTLATLSAQGLGPSRTPVFWMGLNLQNPMNGVVDAALLPLWPGDRVELRAGGQSAALGSGAMGGSVLIEPAWEQLSEQKNGWRGSVSAATGSFGRLDGSAALDLRAAKWNTLWRVAGRQAANDFPFRNTAQLGRPEVRQQNNFQEVVDFQQFNQFKLAGKSRLQTAFWRQTAFRQIPPTMTQAVVDSWQRDRATRALIQWNRPAGSSAQWTARLAWLDETIFFHLPSDTDSSRSRTLLGAADYGRSQGRSLFWKAGLQAQQQYARADGYADSTVWYAQARLAGFAMAECRWGRGRLSALVRQEWAEKQAAPFTWSLGGQWPVGRHTTVQLHASRNYALPTFNDRYWRAWGNTALRPEKGYSTGAQWSWQDEAFHLELRGYSLWLDDWILWQPGADGIFRPGNLRRVWSRGAEIAARYQRQWGAWQGSAAGRYQWTRSTTTAVYAGGDEALHRQLPYTPEHTASLNLRLRRAGWQAAYLHQWTGSRSVTSDESRRLPAFQLGTLLMGYSWKNASRLRLSADLRLENCWNTPFQWIEYRPMPGRALRLGAEIGF